MAVASATAFLASAVGFASAQPGAIRPATGPTAAYVDVSVATLWTNPSKPRPKIDTPALTNPVDLQQWLDNMPTRADRLELTLKNATQTQALLGNKVYILAQQKGWDEVAVPGQPTPKNPLGYPGWVPAVQLVQSPAYAQLQNRPFALVNGAPTVWLYNDPQLSQPFMQISYDTRLPVLELNGNKTAIEVQTPTQGPKWLSTKTADVYTTNSDIPYPTAAQLVKTEEMFVGGTYLWAGRSGFMVDSSGLPELVYDGNGITIPRDENAQAISGLWFGYPRLSNTDVAGLKLGDELFYAGNNGTDTEGIYHGAMYVGNGEMEEAYGAGFPVRITPIRVGSGSDYWGAIQFLNPPHRIG